MKTAEAHGILRDSFTRNLSEKIERIEKRETLPNNNFIGTIKRESEDRQPETIRTKKAAEVETLDESIETLFDEAPVETLDESIETLFQDGIYQPLEVERYEDNFTL